MDSSAADMVDNIASFDEKALGRAIADARRRSGLTQQELCKHLNISYSALTKIERGAIKAPSVFTVAQIAQICGVSIESLIGSPSPGSVASTAFDTPLARSRSGVSFVYFDINGCMVRFFQRAFTELASATGINADIIENTFWHYNDSVCKGEISLEEFNRRLGERIGADNIDWKSYYMRAVDAIEEVHECASWALSQGYRIGLLSNIMPGFIDDMIKRGLLPDLPYSAVVDSSQVGAIKPESKIYEIATERSGLGPSEILLVDDSRTNLMAAEKHGWHVLWFDDFRPTDSVARIKSALAQ